MGGALNNKPVNELTNRIIFIEIKKYIKKEKQPFGCLTKKVLIHIIENTNNTNLVKLFCKADKKEDAIFNY